MIFSFLVQTAPFPGRNINHISWKHTSPLKKQQRSLVTQKTQGASSRAPFDKSQFIHQRGASNNGAWEYTGNGGHDKSFFRNPHLIFLNSQTPQNAFFLISSERDSLRGSIFSFVKHSYHLINVPYFSLYKAKVISRNLNSFTIIFNGNKIK